MSAIKAFIFDLDGVLVFTDKFHYKAWKKLTEDLGIPFDETINNRLRGVSRKESLEIILANAKVVFTQAQKQCFLDTKNSYYRQLLDDLTPNDVSLEVKETLNVLRQNGYKLAIGSSSENAKFILNKIELIDWFDAISDGTIITYSKPHPEVFLKAAAFLDVPPSSCIVVEDACAGIDAAKAAEMTAIGMGDAAHYAQADYSIKKFCDLLSLSL
jgi:beta-phosphoglucomutase